MPNRTWSVPKAVNNTGLEPSTDNSIVLRWGEIFHLQTDRITILQNICENETDFIEWSIHGDPDGVWHRLYPAYSIKFDSEIYLLNRTDTEEIAVPITYLATEDD